MKFRIESPEHSEAIQRELIRLKLCSEKVKSLPGDYMFVANGLRTWHFDEDYYSDHPYTETTLEELKQMK